MLKSWVSDNVIIITSYNNNGHSNKKIIIIIEMKRKECERPIIIKKVYGSILFITLQSEFVHFHSILDKVQIKYFRRMQICFSFAFHIQTHGRKEWLEYIILSNCNANIFYVIHLIPICQLYK